MLNNVTPDLTALPSTRNAFFTEQLPLAAFVQVLLPPAWSFIKGGEYFKTLDTTEKLWK